jgi:RES domain-containing protein
MQCWRIVKQKWAADAFSGEGAKNEPGRWNLFGTAMVYCSETLSLAALELFMRIKGHGRKTPFVRFQVDIPDAIAVETISTGMLPANWDCVPPLQYTKEWGSQWASEKRTVALKVPSVAITGEFNVLLNPLHPDFNRVVIYNPPQAFTFDPRMWGPTPNS